MNQDDLNKLRQSRDTPPQWESDEPRISGAAVVIIGAALAGVGLLVIHLVYSMVTGVF